MSEKKFPSLSEFLSNTKDIQKKNADEILRIDRLQKEAQKVVNESSVTVTMVYNSNNPDINPDISNKLKDSIATAVAMNVGRLKSILDDLLDSVEGSKEHENYWIDRLSRMFNIPDNLTLEDKKALIDKNLAESDDALKFCKFLVESGVNK